MAKTAFQVVIDSQLHDRAKSAAASETPRLFLREFVAKAVARECDRVERRTKKAKG